MRRWLGVAGLVLAALFGAALAALYVRAGDLVAAEASRVARDRYGVELSVGDASVGLRSVSLRRLHVGLPGIDGAGASIESLEVRGSLWRLLRRRLRGAEHIELRGVHAVLRLDAPTAEALHAWWSARRAARAPVASAAPPEATLPAVSVTEGVGEIDDEHGPLARVDLRAARLEGDEFSLEFSRALLGSDTGDALDAAGATVVVDLAERKRLRRVHANTLDVRWADAGGSLRGDVESRIVKRLRAAATRARHVLRSDAPTDAEPPRNPLDRFSTADFAASVDAANVHAGDGGATTRMRFGQLGMRRVDADRIALVGRGEGDEGVGARFDLRVDPAILSAEGTVALTKVPLSLLGPLVPDVPFEASMPGRVSVDVSLVAPDPTLVTFRGALAVEGAALDSSRLAPDPIRDIAFRVEGEGRFDVRARQLELGTARFGVGGVQVDWRGTATVGPGAKRVVGSLVMAPTSCDRAVHALPADVLGPLAGFRLAGSLAGQIDLSVDLAQLDATRFDVHVADGCEFLEAPPLADLGQFEGPFHHQVTEPDGTVFEMDTGPGTRRWTSFSAISPFVAEAVISHEDAAFYAHSGFAPWAIRDAIVRNLREGRYVVGASTLTMQLAKNLFLRREKTLVRKVQEVLLTWWLERALDKHRILELYLNVVEFGPSIYGIRSAAHYYFDCEPAAITPVGAAYLALILPAPKRLALDPGGPLTDGMRTRIGRFLDHMAGQQRLDAETLAAARAELDAFRFRAGAADVTPVDADVPDEPTETPAETGGPEDVPFE